MPGKKSENEPVEIPLEIVPETPETAVVAAQPAGEAPIEGELVQVNQSNVAQVNAERVEFKQGSAARVNAEQVTVHQGGVGMLQATTVSVDQGGVGIVRANEATLSNSSAQLVVAQTATVNGGMASVLVANEVHVGANEVLVGSNEMHANPLRAVIVLAKKIDGPIETALDTRGAILAGLVAGIALGLVSLVGRLLTRRNHSS